MPPTATMRKRKKEIIPQTSKRGKIIIAESDNKKNKLQVVTTPIKGKENFDESLGDSKTKNTEKVITDDLEVDDITGGKNN